MRGRVVVFLITALALSEGSAAAQEAEVVRKELEQMRRQLNNVRQQYQETIDAMTERLRRLEAQPQTAPPPPMVTQAPPATPTLRDYAQPRPPFSLAERSGRGQILFDIGVAGDFVANLTQDNVDRANAGTFEGRENRFFPREIELSLFGQIDPYARGEVRLEAAEEFEDGQRDLHVGLAEAHLTLLTLPWGTQLKLGKVRNRFGLLNQIHPHDLPQIDPPNVLRRYFGEEGLTESGAELTWVAPLPFYVEGLVGLFNGDNEDAFGRGSLKSPLVTGRLRTFFELGDLGAIQLGASAASGGADEGRRQTFAGFDIKYKLTPDGWRHPFLTLASEGIGSFRRRVFREDTGDHTSRDRFGWYAYAEAQPRPRWAGGVRYDSTQLLEDPGREWAVQPYITFRPSDFLRFRLAWKHTERDQRDTFSANDASGRIADEILLQASFILGAHPPHPF
jgi:hypothetical protein